jgi:hypothetical protein
MIKALSIVRSILSISFQTGSKTVEKQYIQKGKIEARAPNRLLSYLFLTANLKKNRQKLNILEISVKLDHQIKNLRQPKAKIIMSIGRTKLLNIWRQI